MPVPNPDLPKISFSKKLSQELLAVALKNCFGLPPTIIL